VAQNALSKTHSTLIGDKSKQLAANAVGTAGKAMQSLATPGTQANQFLGSLFGISTTILAGAARGAGLGGQTGSVLNNLSPLAGQIGAPNAGSAPDASSVPNANAGPISADSAAVDDGTGPADQGTDSGAAVDDGSAPADQGADSGASVDDGTGTDS